MGGLIGTIRQHIAGVKTLLLVLVLASPLAAAEDWKQYQLGEAILQAPADWRIDYQQPNSGYRLTSPDGDYALLAQWWFADETLNNGEVLVSRTNILVDGRPAKLLHSRFSERQVLKLIPDAERADRKRFIVVLESNRHDFSNGSAIHREIVSRVRLGPRPVEKIAPTPVAEDDLPDLKNHLGQDCRPVDPATWKHPALDVVRQRKSTHLHWVKLCASDAYPVFGVRFDFDPQGQTKDFFYPLYLDMLAATGGRPFAFVEFQDYLLIQVRQDGPDQIDLNTIELAKPSPSEQ